MKRCAECGGHNLAAGETSQTLTVGEREYRGTLASTVCGDCGAAFVEGSVLERFELQVAAAALAAGDTSGETLKFARKALGLKASELGELLGVAAETVSRWETGKRDADRGTLATLGALVRDKLAGRTDTLATLRAMREPSPASGPVDLGRVA